MDELYSLLDAFKSPRQVAVGEAKWKALAKQRPEVSWEARAVTTLFHSLEFNYCIVMITDEHGSSTQIKTANSAHTSVTRPISSFCAHGPRYESGSAAAWTLHMGLGTRLVLQDGHCTHSDAIM